LEIPQPWGGVVAHQRFRKYKTNDYNPDHKLGMELAMAVRAGNHVFLRGQTAMAFDGSIVGVGDPIAQAEHAMQCVKILLEEAGAKLEHICKIHIYVTDRAFREPVYQVVGKWLKGVFPCSTGLIVSGLARPELLMEIDVDAVIPEPTGAAAMRTTADRRRQRAPSGGRTPRISRQKRE
jgi:enamine deaminase RidA (YjgF/YER057c/UK114 family)